MHRILNFNKTFILNKYILHDYKNLEIQLYNKLIKPTFLLIERTVRWKILYFIFSGHTAYSSTHVLHFNK